MKEYSDAQVNDCAERLSQLGIPVNGSTNPKVGYIKNRMCCDACVYGGMMHEQWCIQGYAEGELRKLTNEDGDCVGFELNRTLTREQIQRLYPETAMRQALREQNYEKLDTETKRIAGEYDKLFRNPPRVTSACERCVYGSGEHAGWCVSRPHIPFSEATKDWPKGAVGKWHPW